MSPSLLAGATGASLKEVGRTGRINELRAVMIRGLPMLEALVIIVALGGLEIVLWYFDRREQKKEIDLLESIWAELAIRNSVEEEPHPSSPEVAAPHRRVQ